MIFSYLNHLNEEKYENGENKRNKIHTNSNSSSFDALYLPLPSPVSMLGPVRTQPQLIPL